MSRPFLAIRADGGAGLGMGHLVKQAILLRELQTSLRGVKTCFFIKRDFEGIRWLRSKRLPVRRIPVRLSKASEPDWMLKYIPTGVPAVFVLDLLDTGAAYVRSLKKSGARVVTLENRSLGRLEADIAVNAIVDGPVSGVERRGGHTTFRGARYRVFHPEYERVNRRVLPSRRAVKHLLVTFGGGEDNGLSLFAAREIVKMIPGARVTVVRGPAAQAVQADPPKGVCVINSPVALAQLLAGADAGLICGGGTLYEFALMGVPAVAFAKKPHQVRNIRSFVHARTVRFGGRLSLQAIRRGVLTLSRLIGDEIACRRMSTAGKRLVDGRGTARVASLIRRELAVHRHKGD